MASKLSRLRAFGRQIAEAQDEALRGNESVSQARERLLAPRDSAQPARSWRAWAAWSAVAAAVACAACFLVWRARPGPMVFDVGPLEAAPRGAQGERGRPGEWIAASTGQMPVRFSDGSIVRLEADSRARVVTVTDHGAGIVLERGGAHVDVVHRHGSRWNVQAGPFEVHVRGTTFDVSWDPVRELFSVTLEEGSVTVAGCSLPLERVVAKGETLRARCRDGEVVLTDPSNEESPPPVQATQPAETPPEPTAVASAENGRAALPPSASASAAPADTVARPSSDVAPPRPAWRDLLLAGRYAEALDAADALGLPTLCDHADAEGLAGLGDAARFAGRADDAEFVLRAIRRRFPEDERASVAAFHLGRIAFDQRGAFAEATRWFETYLRERPQGAFSREASGRLIEALDRSGDRSGAIDAARRYLLEYPTGPHAETARSLVGK